MYVTDKIELYKTAFSSMYNKYVQINATYKDSAGKYVIIGRVSGEKEEILFRENELSNFGL